MKKIIKEKKKTQKKIGNEENHKRNVEKKEKGNEENREINMKNNRK